MRRPRLIEIDDRSRISQCRRIAKAQAKHFGFSEVDTEHIGIAVSEAVSNIVRHAGRGWCMLQPVILQDETYLEVLLWDEGPGIQDFSKCLKDGYSSGDGQGIGLGAIKRLMDNFEVFSKPKGGLCMSFKLCPRSIPLPLGEAVRESSCPKGDIDLFGTAIALAGQRACGDSWAYAKPVGSKRKVFLVDGLGHGTHAEEAAQLAVDAFQANSELSGQEIMKSVNAALNGSRGAVGAVAEIDVIDRTIHYTGVGNISGRILNPEGKTVHLISKTGILGNRAEVNPVTYANEFPESGSLILHTDGLTSRWQLKDLLGLPFRSSATIASVVMSLARKATDDSGLVIAKLKDGVR